MSKTSLATLLTLSPITLPLLITVSVPFTSIGILKLVLETYVSLSDINVNIYLFYLQDYKTKFN